MSAINELPYKIISDSDKSIFSDSKSYLKLVEEKLDVKDTKGAINVIQNFYENIIDKLPVQQYTPSLDSLSELKHESDFVSVDLEDLSFDKILIYQNSFYKAESEKEREIVDVFPKEYIFFRALIYLVYELNNKSYDIKEICDHYFEKIKINYVRFEYKLSKKSHEQLSYIDFFRKYIEIFKKQIVISEDIYPQHPDEMLEEEMPLTFAGRIKNIYYTFNHYVNISKPINFVVKLLSKRLSDYEAWIQENEIYDRSVVESEINMFSNKPKIGIFIDVSDTEIVVLEKTLNSIAAQYYSNWEICLIGNDQNIPLKQYGEISKFKGKYKTKFTRGNLSTAQIKNSGLETINSDFITFINPGDLMANFALYEIVKIINNNPAVEFIYTDEDKIDEITQKRFEPFFKPEWSPETILSMNYIGDLKVFSKKVFTKIGNYNNDLDGLEDYDLILRIAETLDRQRIAHVAKVLVHTNKKIYINEDQNIKVVNLALHRRKIKGEANRGLIKNTVKINLKIENKPLVSIIIPVKDNIEDLKTCIESIEDKTDYKNYEIIVVDNNSEELKSHLYFEEISTKYKVITFSAKFNYSAINNYAVQYTEGEHLLFLNNDTEVINSSWLEELLMLSQLKEVGAVGAKLYFPDDTIQHGGVILGIRGIAGHPFSGLPKDSEGYLKRLKIMHNISAVTGACLMLKKSVFLQVGQFNEVDLPVAFNDVDLCIRILQFGYRNIFTPYAELYHHESKSRGLEDTPEKQSRFQKECHFMSKTWEKVLMNDLYYSPNLTLENENYSYKLKQNNK